MTTKVPLSTAFLCSFVAARMLAATATPGDDPATAVDFVNTGVFKQGDGNLRGAIRDFSQAIRLDPRSVLAWSSRADAERLQGLTNDAVADYQQALRLDSHWRAATEGLRLIRHSRTLPVGKDPAAPTPTPRPAKGDLRDKIPDLFAPPNSLVPNRNLLAGRGAARFSSGDYTGAIEAYSSAIELDSQDAELLYRRGQAKRFADDIPGALADETRAIELDAACLPAFLERGSARRMTGDFTGAKADQASALKLDPTSAPTFWSRALLAYVQRDWQAAGENFRRYCEYHGPEEDWARFMIYWTRWHLGEGKAATEELAAYALQPAQAEPRIWAAKVVAFLAGRVSEEALLSAAAPVETRRGLEQHCDVWFQLGMKNLFAGDKSAAAKFFRQCRENSAKTSGEFILADSELGGLESSR